MPEKDAEKKEWVDWLSVKVLQKTVVVDEAGNCLAIKRADDRPGARPDKWDLPGGSMSLEDLVSASQPHIEAIGREVKEETGLEIDEVEPVWIGSGAKKSKTAGDVLIYAVGFKCKVKGTKPEVRLSEEHVDSMWGTKEEVLLLDFGDDGGMHPSIVRKA